MVVVTLTCRRPFSKAMELAKAVPYEEWQGLKLSYMRAAFSQASRRAG